MLKFKGRKLEIYGLVKKMCTYSMRVPLHTSTAVYLVI